MISTTLVSIFSGYSGTEKKTRVFIRERNNFKMFQNGCNIFEQTGLKVIIQAKTLMMASLWVLKCQSV